MPETITAAPPPQSTPPPQPSPSPAPQIASQQSGTASLMEDMDSYMAKPSPEPKSEKATEPKQDQTKQPDLKPQIAPVKEKDPIQLRKRLAEVESDLTKTRAEKEQTVSELQRKMADLEKREFLTDDQKKRYGDMEQRTKSLEAALYSRNYSESPEFKDKYQKRWHAKYESAVKEVGRLNLKVTDPETGDEKYRPATQSDFERVRMLRGSEVAQLDEAEKIFGNRASLVVKYCNELDSIEQAAQEDVATRRERYDQEMQQAQEMQGRAGQMTIQSAQATEAMMAERYPAFFGKSEDPELEAAMKKGMEFVDTTTSTAGNLNPEERGQRLAVIRMWAGAFPRNAARINKMESELTELRAKLAKLQGTDPGAGGDSPSPDKKSDDPKGTAGLMAEF